MDPGAEQFARLDRFASLVAGGAGDVRLDRTALAMASVLRARPVDGALDELDGLAADCRATTFDELRRYLFEDLGFGGDAEHYDEPCNSFLDVVLQRRRGLPILLATVMIEVGRRVGIGVEGVGMPLHFLVRDASNADAFADPFAGAALDRRGARARFETISAGRLPWEDRHLEPTAPRMIVVRMLTNLLTSYGRRGDAVHLALVARMRASIPELQAETGEAVRLSAVFN